MTNEYLNALLKSEKYQLDKQYQLKQRVFTTFDSLLRHAGRPGLESGRKLLDLGSADGALVRVAQDHGLESHGLDVTDGINFETDRFPHDDDTFDVVTGVSLIEHLHSPGMMFRETLRVLKPGGSIILVTPNWKFSFRDFFDDPTHVHPYSPASLKFALGAAGFQDARVVPWLVCKPAWMWDLRYAFQFARMIPFRGSQNPLIPDALKGKSKSILALGNKQS